MPDPIRDSESTPPDAFVRNYTTPKPTGVLPKNAQTWAIAGLSAVMVAAIALSGSGTKGRAPAPSPRQASVIDPNASRIAEYRSRLDEETRKLANEQAALNQAKQAAVASDPRVTAIVQPSVHPNGNAPQPPAPPDDHQSAKRQLEAEREHREYNSLFASNVALSFRNNSRENDTETGVPTVSALSALTAASPNSHPVPPAAPASNVGDTQGATPGADNASARAPMAETPEARQPESQRSRPQPNPAATQSKGLSYHILEGTVIEAVLTNRLDGSLAGPVNAMLTTDVFSHDRQHLLIPQGSRILGEVKPVANTGQQRLAVAFHRIIMPDGYSLSLDHFEGLNQVGETGLRDQVNHHYIEIFGVSMAIGAVAGLSQANTQYGATESAVDVYGQGVAASLSQSALRILDRFLNILPTFTIREGQRIKVYLASDLVVPAYDRHKVPSEY